MIKFTTFMKPGRITLFIIDSLSLTMAFSASMFIRQSAWIIRHFEPITYGTKMYLTSYIIGVVLLFVVFGAFKLYQIRNIELSARIFTVLKALVVWTLLITLLVYVLKFDFSRAVLFLSVIFTTIFITFGRFAYFKYRQNKNKGD